MLTSRSAGTYRPFHRPGALFLTFYDRQGCLPYPRYCLTRKRLPICPAPAQEIERPQLLAAELGWLQRKGFVFSVNLL